jgi:hypothetical protein
VKRAHGDFERETGEEREEQKRAKDKNKKNSGVDTS